MAIHLRQNQYRGINAHLHSYFQRSGGWVDFHRAHIQHLTDSLTRALQGHAEYRVCVEESLQLAHYDLFAIEETSVPLPETPQENFSDNLRDLSDIGTMAARPSAVLPISNLFLEEQAITAILIYYNDALTTRIELISPASKPSGSHHRQYVINRSGALCHLVKLVELDYLHERRSLIADLPNYMKRERGAYPFHITVGQMRSASGPGETRAYGFRVEDPIPVIPIPLHNSDVLTFDFNMAYHRTFTENTLNGLRIVDYTELPEGFESYDREDQARIKRRMEIVRTQYQTAE